MAKKKRLTKWEELNEFEQAFQTWVAARKSSAPRPSRQTTVPGSFGMQAVIEEALQHLAVIPDGCEAGIADIVFDTLVAQGWALEQYR